MPMRYPPLADGTYRYGDPPQPKPSPVPGPDPAGPADSPATAGPANSSPTTGPAAPSAPGQPPFTPPTTPGSPPADGPPPEREPARRRSDGLAAGAIVGVAALVVVILGLAFYSPGGDSDGTDRPRGPLPQAGPPPAPSSAEFTVEGTFTVVSTPGEPVSGTPGGCEMPPTLTDIGEGTPITLLQSDFSPLSTARLVYDGGDLASCTFTFEFTDVPAGIAVYMVELSGRGQLLYSEAELRAGVDITLGR